MQHRASNYEDREPPSVPYNHATSSSKVATLPGMDSNAHDMHFPQGARSSSTSSTSFLPSGRVPSMRNTFPVKTSYADGQY